MKGFSTIAVHAGSGPDPATGANAVPIYQTASFVFPDALEGANRFAGASDGFIYSRLGNPTVAALEAKLAALEGAEAAVAFASGMAAISAIFFSLLSAGDHVVASRTLYGSTYSLLERVLSKFGVTATFVDTTDLAAVEAAFTERTKLLFLETPANPTMELIDLEACAALARAHGLLTVVDNTFLTPYGVQPLSLGCDLVVHSATKYLGGHGDVIAGLLAGSSSLIATVRSAALKDMGGVLDPFAAYLVLRGMKSLAVRMARHNETALALAEWLSGHPAVSAVYYPGLPSHPQHALAKRQLRGAGGVLSFEVAGGLPAARRLLDRVQLCHLAVSLGDVESLICHPASMTHATVPLAARLAMGVTDSLVRLAVGLEDVDDLMADLSQGLIL